MSTLIITGSYSPGWSVAAKTLPSKQAWCARHSYSLLNIDGWPRQAFCWQKIELAQHYIGSFDVVAWLDADSFVSNPSLALPDVINSDFGCNVSSDWNASDLQHLPRGAWFSAGNIVWTRRASLLFAMLERLRASHVGRPNDQWHEQAALQTIAREKMPGWEQIHILPGPSLNAVPVEIQPETANPHDPSCLLAHLTTVDDAKRVEWIESMQAKTSMQKPV